MRFLDSVYTPLLTALLTTLCSVAHANPTQLTSGGSEGSTTFHAMSADGSRIALDSSASSSMISIDTDAETLNEESITHKENIQAGDNVVFSDVADTVFFSSSANLLLENNADVRSIFSRPIPVSPDSLAQISPPDVHVLEFEYVSSTSTVFFTSNTGQSGMNPNRSIQVFSVAADGSNFTQISEFSTDQSGVTQLHASSDGDKIVFASPNNLVNSNPDSTPEVYLLDNGSTDLTRVTEHEGSGSVPVGVAARGMAVLSVIAFVSTADHTDDNPDNELQFFVANEDGSETRQVSNFTAYPGPGATPDNPADALSDLNPRLSRNGDMLFFTATNFDENGEKTEESASVDNRDIYYFDLNESTLNRAIANAQLLDVSTGASGNETGGFGGGGTYDFAFKSGEDFDADGVKEGNADGSREIFHFVTGDLADAPGALTHLGPAAEYPYSNCPECLVGEESGGGSANALLFILTLCGFFSLCHANGAGRAQRRFTENRRN